jgi:hypothetical protein
VGALVDELPLPRRVQLAVVAHIRHTYTDYDKLLKTILYQAARREVEAPTLAKFVEWRGDEDDKQGGMEDILAEVIVIDDDDDDNDGPQKAITASLSDQDPSHEMLVAHQRGQIDRRTDPKDYAALPYRGKSIDSDEMQAATSLGGGQFVFDPRRTERAVAQRSQAWQEAKRRQRRPDVGYERVYITGKEQGAHVPRAQDHLQLVNSPREAAQSASMPIRRGDVSTHLPASRDQDTTNLVHRHLKYQTQPALVVSTFIPVYHLVF